MKIHNIDPDKLRNKAYARCIRNLRKNKESFTVFEEGNTIRRAVTVHWNQRGDMYNFQTFFEDTGESHCGGRGASNPYYTGPKDRVFHEEVWVSRKAIVHRK